MKGTYKRNGNVLRFFYWGLVKQKHNTVFLMHTKCGNKSWGFRIKYSNISRENVNIYALSIIVSLEENKFHSR